MKTIRQITQWIIQHRTLSLLLILVLSGTFIFARMVQKRSQGTLTKPLEKGEIIDAVYGIGTVTATRSFSVKPGIIASIDRLYIKEGDPVRKGQKLAVLDGNLYHAPFAGVINFLPFKVGENIFTQLPVFVLTDLTDRYIVVSLEQQGELRVRPGQKAKLSFDTIRNQSYDGTVASVYSYNKNFLARIDVSSLPPEILPDMTADIAIIIREIPDALVIPVAAFENGSVWLKRGHLFPVKVPVTLGIVDGISAEVTSGGLKAGDVLVVHTKVL